MEKITCKHCGIVPTAYPETWCASCIAAFEAWLFHAECYCDDCVELITCTLAQRWDTATADDNDAVVSSEAYAAGQALY